MNDDDSSTSSSCVESLDGKLRTVQHESANKLSQLAQHATKLMDRYSDEKCTDFNNEPLRVYDEMASVANEMKEAWKEYNENVASVDCERKNQEEENESKFRAAYLHLVTEAFSDELDDLRHGRIKSSGSDMKTKVPDILKQDNIVIPREETVDNGSVDVDILVEMLESEDWTKDEKELLLVDLQSSNGMDTDTLTIHERRRREIFGTKD